MCATKEKKRKEVKCAGVILMCFNGIWKYRYAEPWVPVRRCQARIHPVYQVIFVGYPSRSWTTPVTSFARISRIATIRTRVFCLTRNGRAHVSLPPFVRFWINRRIKMPHLSLTRDLIGRRSTDRHTDAHVWSYGIVTPLPPIPSYLHIPKRCGYTLGGLISRR